MSDHREVSIVVDGDDYAFLELEGEERALTPEQIVQMLVRKARKARKASERPVVILERADEAEARLRAKQEAEAARQARLLAELAALEPPTEAEIDKTVASADAWMKGSMFDPNRPDEFDESQLPREPVEHHGVAIAPPRNAGVGSLTAPAGIRSDLQAGHVIGDPMGNIVRQNFRHLGAR